MSNSALIALGTNVAFKGVGGAALLTQALTALRDAGLSLRAVSSAWESPAWPPGSEQAEYSNAVIEADAGALDPEALYLKLRAVEAAFGRERRERWGPRTLDLDILAMEGWVGTFGAVTLPHKRLHERAFVLLPLAEVSPDWRHPGSGQTARELAAALPSGHGARLADPLAIP